MNGKANGVGRLPYSFSHGHSMSGLSLARAEMLVQSFIHENISGQIIFQVRA